MINKKKTFVQEQPKPKRLTDKEMHQLLTNLKKEAGKTPEEKGSGKDMGSKK